MRWITFFILLYVATALRWVHLFALSAHDHTQIEYVALLAIFYALYAGEEAAPLCGLCCGLALDLITADVPLGTNAVPLALVTFAVVKIRLSIFREHVISQVIIAIAGIVLFGVLSGLLRAAMAPSTASRAATFWDVCYPVSINALYSGVVAPLLFWLLRRLGALLGFETARSRKR